MSATILKKIVYTFEFKREITTTSKKSHYAHTIRVTIYNMYTESSFVD